VTVTYDYAGKSVLVTGGTRGIGAGIAAAFHAAGADVTVCARTGPERPGHRFVQADVRDPEQVDRLIGGFGRLDVVVNNAGGSPHAPVEGTSPRLHARVIELNLTAPLLVSQRAYPLLAASGGAVVMIGSASGARPSLVRVNTVVVGLAATRDAADHYGGRSDLDGRAIPAGRMATPADVAAACLWLAAPGYVTGAEVRVDGGGEVPAWRHLV
jgi:NAD(P)-dependent dehydrogenase (short-subunit alcohol dehydrogenase family)